jgi:hypothetical protein
MYKVFVKWNNYNAHVFQYKEYEAALSSYIYQVQDTAKHIASLSDRNKMKIELRDTDDKILRTFTATSTKKA